TRADPASLGAALVGLLSLVTVAEGPRTEPAGVVPWAEVAAGILTVARESASPATDVPERVRPGLGQVRVSLAVLGVALLLLGGMRDLTLSSDLVGAAYLALLAATL